MTCARCSYRLLSSVMLTVATVSLACNGDAGGNPTAEDARKSLVTALETWRGGGKPAELASVDPPIHVIDSEWTNGQKLTGFEIVREESAELDKRFTVKLVRTPPGKTEEVVYIVLGSGTHSVFREADYERTMNMDNNPVPKKKRR